MLHLRRHSRSALAALLGICVCLAATGVQAQDPAAPYQVGKSDVLNLSIWQRPELDRSLTVDDSGRLTVPLIGLLEAEGRTLDDLEQEILERMQVFHRDISRVSLEVSAYNSKAIYVLGAVTSPGKHAIYPIPNLWEAIREAGGAAPDGDLTRVRIFREIDGRQILETYNLQQMLMTEGAISVPALSPGETVEVPRQPTAPGAYTGRDRIYVLGYVASPGIYRIEQGSQDVLGFILQAGGPQTNSNMGRVLLLRSGSDGSLTRLELDLMDYLERVDAQQNPQVLPGDTIFVPRETQVSGIISSNLGILTGFATLLTSILLFSTRN